MSERRVNPLLDLVNDLEGGRLNANEAVEQLVRIAADHEGDRALVDEAIDLGVITEGQREATMRLLASAPEETRALLDDMGLTAVREYADQAGWERTTRRLTRSSSEEQERREIAEHLGMRVEDVI